MELTWRPKTFSPNVSGEQLHESERIGMLDVRRGGGGAGGGGWGGEVAKTLLAWMSELNYLFGNKEGLRLLGGGVGCVGCFQK